MLKCEHCGKTTTKNVRYTEVSVYRADAEKGNWGYVYMEVKPGKQYRHDFCPKCSKKLSKQLDKAILKAAHAW